MVQSLTIAEGSIHGRLWERFDTDEPQVFAFPVESAIRLDRRQGARP